MGLFEDLTDRNNGDEVDASWWNSIIVALRNAFPDYTALTGDVVGTTDTQDISNKRFTDGITLEEQASTPSNPASGDKKLYAKDDGKVYTLNSAGDEVEVGSGAGGGTKSYIDQDSAKFESNLGSWETDNGSGSAATTLTLSRNTVTPLSGDGDLTLAKSAADGNGEFIKVTTETIDRSDRGNILFFSANVDATDVSYTGNLEFEFYDNTNAAVLYAGSSEDLSILSGLRKQNLAVYLESTTAEIEVRIKVNDTDTTAYTVSFDDFKLGPAAQVQTVYRKSQTIDLTGSGDFTGGEIQVERVGNIVTISETVDATFASSAIPASAAGLLPEWARPNDTRNNVYGLFSGGTLETFVQSDGALRFEFRDWAGSTLSQTSAFTFAITYSVPDTAGPTLTENELSLQTVRARYVESSAIAQGGTAAIVDFNEVDYDSHGAVTTGASWKFTAPFSTYYKIRAQLVPLHTGTNANQDLFIVVDGSTQAGADILVTASASGTIVGSATLFLEKGQEVDIRSANSQSASTVSDSSRNYVEIESLPDYTVLGAVKERKRTQKKYLTTSITSSGVISDLAFSNLEVGKWYKFEGQIDLSANAGADISVNTSGAVVLVVQHQNRGSGASRNRRHFSVTFKAASTSITFNAVVPASSSVNGGTSDFNTWARLIEIEPLIETSDF